MSSAEFPLRFDNPTYGLMGMLLGGVAVVLFYLTLRRLRIAEKRLELVEWRKLRRIIRILNISTKASVVTALSFLLAAPYFPITIEVSANKASDEQMAQYTVTAMLLMDVSYSMNSTDLKPTRFDVSKTMIKLLVEKMHPKDLVGFISFAGQVYDTVFPTSNRTKIAEEVDGQRLQLSTAIGTALETAIGMLEPYAEGAKAIILFSDGKSNVGVSVSSAVDEAVVLKIPIFTVSVGTYGLVEADPLALRAISEKTGGKFYEVRSEEIENLATSVSLMSHEIKAGALETAYDRLMIPSKDYQTSRVIFSALLVIALVLAWFTGV